MDRSVVWWVVFVGICSVLCAYPSAAAPAITAYLGSEINLTGTSTSGPAVYLFVTGPNLPSNGGRLDNPTVPVRSGDASSFTRAEVDGNDRWTYRWDTSVIGLDAGTYVVYAVDAPVDRSDLVGQSYVAIPVVLLGPGDVGVQQTATPSPTALPASLTLPTPSPSPTTSTPVPTTVAVHCVLPLIAVAAGLLVAVRRRR
jgi:hypothetical protein